MISQEQNQDIGSDLKKASLLLGLVLVQFLQPIYLILRYHNHMPSFTGMWNFNWMWSIVSSLVILVVPFFWKGAMNPGQMVRQFGTASRGKNIVLGLLPLAFWVFAGLAFGAKFSGRSEFSFLLHPPTGEETLQAPLAIMWFVRTVAVIAWVPFILGGVRNLLVRTGSLVLYFVGSALLGLVPMMTYSGWQPSIITTVVISQGLVAIVALGLAKAGRVDCLGLAIFLLSLQFVKFIPFLDVMGYEVYGFFFAAIVIWLVAMIPSLKPGLRTRDVEA